MNSVTQEQPGALAWIKLHLEGVLVELGMTNQLRPMATPALVRAGQTSLNFCP